VRSLVRQAVAGGPCDNMRLVCLALEHDRMHQETLSYMVTQQVTSRLIASLSIAPRTSFACKQCQQLLCLYSCCLSIAARDTLCIGSLRTDTLLFCAAPSR